MFCTQCNTKLEYWQIEDMLTKQRCCPKCSRMELGYNDEEKELVYDLQKMFKGEEYKILNIVLLFRKHTKNL